MVDLLLFIFRILSNRLYIIWDTYCNLIIILILILFKKIPLIGSLNGMFFSAKVSDKVHIYFISLFIYINKLLFINILYLKIYIKYINYNKINYYFF